MGNNAYEAAEIDALIAYEIDCFRPKGSNFYIECFRKPVFEQAPPPSDERKAELQQELDDAFEILNNMIEEKGGTYLFGKDVTIVDFTAFFSLLSICTFADGDYTKHPKVETWYESVTAIPGVKAILEKAKEDFSIAKAANNN